MRLIIFHFNLLEHAIDFINRTQSAHYLHSIVPHGTLYTAIIKFEDYNTYLYYAEKYNWYIMSIEEYYT